MNSSLLTIEKKLISTKPKIYVFTYEASTTIAVGLWVLKR